MHNSLQPAVHQQHLLQQHHAPQQQHGPQQQHVPQQHVPQQLQRACHWEVLTNETMGDTAPTPAANSVAASLQAAALLPLTTVARVVQTCSEFVAGQSRADHNGLVSVLSLDELSRLASTSMLQEVADSFTCVVLPALSCGYSPDCSCLPRSLQLPGCRCALCCQGAKPRLSPEQRR